MQMKSSKSHPPLQLCSLADDRAEATSFCTDPVEGHRRIYQFSDRKNAPRRRLPPANNPPQQRSHPIFYTYTIETGTGPLLNPVQLARSGTRPNAHHNVLEDFRPSGRIRYNPPIPKRRPRTMNDKQSRDVFAALGSNRDRAILAIALSNGARASEILGLKGADIAWGEQLVRVIRKESRDEQWLPVSAESMIWLRLYLNERDHVAPTDSVWQTIRKRSRGSTLTHRPLSYEALRAVFRRLNTMLGNWSMHDLRHTAALRMSRDKNLTLQDLQTRTVSRWSSTARSASTISGNEALVVAVARPQCRQFGAGGGDGSDSVPFRLEGRALPRGRIPECGEHGPHRFACTRRDHLSSVTTKAGCSRGFSPQSQQGVFALLSVCAHTAVGRARSIPKLPRPFAAVISP